MTGRGTLKRVLRRGLLDRRGGPRRYVRLAGEEADLRQRVGGFKSAWQDEPGVVVFGVKPWYLRWFAREVARAGVRILRWRTPRSAALTPSSEDK